MRFAEGTWRMHGSRLALVAVVVATGASVASATDGNGDVFTVDHAARVRTVLTAAISPSGEHTAYLLAVPRKPYDDDDGPAWTELHVVGPGSREARPYVFGEVNVSQVAWTPDGGGISFLAKRGEGEEVKKALWVIPVDGGEARKVVEHDEDISGYSWAPDGRRVAFLGVEKEDPVEEKLEEKGFKAQVYEEDLRPVRVWIATIEDGESTGEHRMLDLDGSASEIHWSPADDRLVLALQPTPLIDDTYMKRKIHVVDVASGEIAARIANPGKLGEVEWSPDGKRIAVISARDLHDPNAGRLMVAPATGGALTNLVPNYEGDVVSVEFQDANTLLYVAHEGMDSLLAEINVDGTARKTLVAKGGPVLRSLSLSNDGSQAALVADSPVHPREVFLMAHGDPAPERRTDSNPWLDELRLAPQEVITYESRDGLEIEAALIRPLEERQGVRHPLIVVVHGGPEAHYSNGWLTRYATPGQFAAAEGYAVLYPNYRGSTGRGVEFSKLHQADYAGGEFNDLVDGVEHLVDTGVADREKVGVTGGSYGGFASAWCATALTEHFAASVMFVGISDQISKFGTTDIPNEMYLVHARRWPWDHWDWFRERSPIYHVEQARTPILILHGREDTRVHPSQSMELYRYLKTLGNVPVRLVFYPGEGHGNRMAAARLDYSRRLMRWMNHYLRGPGGEPPPYGLEHDPDRVGPICPPPEAETNEE